MKATSEVLENSQVVLNIEAEPSEFESALEEAYRNLARKSALPGFRKGKAPRAMLERYLGREAFLEEAIRRLVPQLYNRAVDENKVDAIAEPQFEVTQNEPLIFKATVPVRPTVELGDYHQIKIEPEPAQVEPGEVDKAIEQIRYQQAPWQPVERPVKFGDLVTIDVAAGVEGKLVLDRKGLEYQVVKGSVSPVPGFAEELEGMEKSKEKEFTLPFPDDYPVGQVAGKEGNFKVLVSEVKEKDLPAFDDEFAKSLGEGLESLASLRQRVESNLKAIAEERAKRRLEDKVVEGLAGISKVNFPQILVEREIDHLVSEMERSVEGHLESKAKGAEEVRKQLRPVAEKRIIRTLLVNKVTEQEKIEVTDAEIDEEIEAMAKGVEGDAEGFRKAFGNPVARQSVKEALMTRKTLRRLAEIASGGETKSS